MLPVLDANLCDNLGIILQIFLNQDYQFMIYSTYYHVRECVRMGAAGAQTRRCLGHHFLHPKILTVQLYENQQVGL